MFKKLNLKNIYDTLIDVSKKFPLSVITIITTFISIWFLISLNNISIILENNLLKLIISLIAVFFLSSSTVLLLESFHISKIKNYIFQIFPILFWILFYFSFNNWLDIFYSEEIVYIFLIFIWILSFLFFSPFIKILLDKNYIQDSYYNYFIKIVTIFWMSFILWGSLTILWFIWLGAIFTLFDLNIILNESDFYSYFANFSLIIFTPIFFLSWLSKYKNTNLLIVLDAFSNFLIKYIAVPFIYIYFIILYVYTIKVLLNFNDWPHGEVSWMVIWFSLFGYLIYIFSYWLEKENTSIKAFRKYFPYVVLPQVLMLFYAIYLRINQYDLTINRYFIVVFWICLSVISIYLVFSNKKKLVYLPSILFLFIIFISFWPWWVFTLPEVRQNNILKQNLIEANILKDNKIIIVNNKSDIDEIVSWKIYDLIWYLVNNHWIESVEKIFPELVKEIKQEDKNEWIQNNENFNNDFDIAGYRWINSWNLLYKLREKLKVEPYYPERNKVKAELYYWIDYEEWFFPLEISWYDYITKIYSSSYNLENSWVNGKTIWLINIDKKELTLLTKENVLDTINIEEILSTISTYNWDYNEKNTKDEMTFDISSDKYDYRLFIQSISLRNPEFVTTNTDELKSLNYIWYNTEWYILVRKK
jgi:hypothetical protein